MRDKDEETRVGREGETEKRLREPSRDSWQLRQGQRWGTGEGNRGAFRSFYAPLSRTPFPVSAHALRGKEALREKQTFRPPPSQPVAQAFRQLADPLCSG